MTAFELGWIAAEDGHAMSACPFLAISGAAIAWRNGYRAMLASVGLEVA